METKNLIEIVISVLTTLITGGFIIILIELSNRKKREYDNFRDIVKPFLEKLSAYCRLVLLYEPIIYFVDDSYGEEAQFKRYLNYITKIAKEMICSEKHFTVSDCLSSKINDTLNVINEIGQLNDSVKHIRVNELNSRKMHLESELSKIDPKYLSHVNDKLLLNTLSNDFYTDHYLHIVNEIQEYKNYIYLLNIQTKMVFYMILMVIIAISLLLLCTDCQWLPYCALLLVLVLFILALVIMFGDENKQLILFTKFKNIKSNRKIRRNK